MDKLKHIITQHNLQEFIKLKPRIQFKSPKPPLINLKKLSVMSWNVLASGYTSPTVYFYVNPNYLQDNHRLNMILYDIRYYNSDIICLQESEKTNHDYITNHLEEYNGVYDKRPGLTCDGLSILYKKDLFQCKEKILVNLNNLSNIYKHFLKDNLRTNNIAQILLLEPVKALKERIDYLVVINLHLFWDPKQELLKYIQLSEIMNKAFSLKETLKNKKVGIVLCGDFNSQPGTHVANLAMNKLILKDAVLEDKAKAFQNIFKSTNKLGLNDSHVEFYNTNIKHDFTAKLDYIFYSNEVIQHYDYSYFEEKTFLNERALPNSYHGSDHIYLISNFYI
jgi:mRNA deadenylase 3'-5' endonuclease subunit Ccr4